MTKRQIYKKFTNLSQEKLSIKNNKKLMPKKTLRQLLLNIVEEKKREV